MLLVRLLGRPSLAQDDVELEAPRGRKTWGLLAYLVSSGAPVPRHRLSALLFPDAEDGLGALRWNLAQLRRRLRQPQAFAGDPVALALGPDVGIDVQLLARATWQEAADQVDLGAPLLEGMRFPSCRGFELWLEGERQRVAGLCAGALREAALAETAAGRPREAVRYGRRLVQLEPWDETGHELLVRALARSGDVDGARAHAGLVTELFLEQFGVGPSTGLAAAAGEKPAVVRQLSRAGALAATPV